jgi:integrase
MAYVMLWPTSCYGLRHAMAYVMLWPTSCYGLRHAYASVASDSGDAERTIAALLGHATRTMTGRYIHHLDAALIAAANAVSDRIASALDGRRAVADVVQLRPLDAA